MFANCKGHRENVVLVTVVAPLGRAKALPRL